MAAQDSSHTVLDFAGSLRHHRKNVAAELKRVVRELRLDGHPVCLPLAKDLFASAHSSDLVFHVASGHARWSAWITELFDSRPGRPKKPLDPAPILRRLSIRASSELGAKGITTESLEQAEAALSRWIRDRCESSARLADLVGESVFDALTRGSQKFDDGLAPLLSPEVATNLPRDPRVEGTRPHGGSPTTVRSQSGIFREVGRGSLPENPSRLAPIEHAYRAASRNLFLQRAANAELFQRYGDRIVESHLRTSMHVTVDILESIRLHRSSRGEPHRPIDRIRATVCELISNLDRRIDPNRVECVVSLRRRLPSHRAPRETLRFELHGGSRFSSPQKVARFLQANPERNGPGLLSDVSPFDPTPDRFIGRNEEDLGQSWDLAARIVLGDLSRGEPGAELDAVTDTPAGGSSHRIELPIPNGRTRVMLHATVPSFREPSAPLRWSHRDEKSFEELAPMDIEVESGATDSLIELLFDARSVDADHDRRAEPDLLGGLR